MESNADPGEAVLSFSQQVRSLAVGSAYGCTVFDLDFADNKITKFFTSIIKDVFLIERLQETSIIAIVAGDPRRLSVYDLQKQFEIKSYTYDDNILSIKLNKERAIVCMKNSIFIHNIDNMLVDHIITDLPHNFTGVVALSSDSERCYLAYPSSSMAGEVLIHNVITLHTKLSIPAHDTSLAALAFSPSSNEIATACERGIVIRVFSLSDGAKIYEFRRGLARYVTIACLSFSTCGEYLVSSSNTETVHIFQLNRNAIEINESDKKSDDWFGYSLFSYISTTATNYLIPGPITDMFTQDRPFASVHLPTADVKRMCAITKIKDKLRLFVASQDGFLYVYSIPSAEGGVPELIKRFDLFLDYYYPGRDIAALLDSGILASRSTSRSTSTSKESASATSSYQDDEKPSTSKNCRAAACKIKDKSDP